MSMIDIALEAAGSDSSLIRKTISRLAVNQLASSTAARPRPFSLWSNLPKPEDPNITGPVSDYTTWPGLTDRTFSSRHLPPAPQSEIDALPENGPPNGDVPGPIAALFERKAFKTDRSSVLFSYFAQWFTDSFLRTSPTDRRKNTSNHEIDLCQIYGLTEEVTRMLRSGVDGTLSSQIINGDEYPDALYLTGEDGRPTAAQSEIQASSVYSQRAT